MTKVLILDASKSMRNTLRERLEYEGFSTETADSETVVRALCHRKSFDVLLTDRAVCLEDAAVPYIILSAEGSLDAAIAAVRDGAEDFLTKPIDMNRLLQSIHRAVAHGEESPAIPMVRPSTRKTRRAGAACGPTEAIIGSSAEIVRVRNLIAKVAPCEARVLITGENGTGKELVARHLHALSPRAAAPFVEVNCAAIPSELIESELFGHERGAFTSAIKQRKGKFELADGGTK